tara:strand:+ start:194 stop:1078 length:885 start_codon:yes stop_codon:yes gene_type:complete
MNITIYITIYILILVLVLVYVVNFRDRKGFMERDIIDTNYINKFNRKDKIARGIGGGDILDYYYNNIRELDKTEKKRVSQLFDIINEKIKQNNKYKKWLEIYFKVYRFDKLENNFPHTHHNNILIPDIFRLDNTYSILNTLLHEKIHILQRFKKDMFYDLYENYWGFKKIKINKLEEIEKHSRTNPDGVNNNWVFSRDNTRIVLLSIYNKNSSSLSDVYTVGVYLDSNYNIIVPIKKRKIGEIREFTSFFGNLNGNNYHPNEISAEMLAGYLLDRNTKNIPAYRALDRWWKHIE